MGFFGDDSGPSGGGGGIFGEEMRAISDGFSIAKIIMIPLLPIIWILGWLIPVVVILIFRCLSGIVGLIWRSPSDDS